MYNISGYYSTFNNCREQGYLLKIYEIGDDNDLCIWAFQERTSDRIAVIIADGNCCDQNAMFDDKAYSQIKYFSHNDYDSAIDYAYNVIKLNFSKNISEEININFNMNYSLKQIEHISYDINSLEYEDYKSLAHLEYDENPFMCDLVIHNKKLSLQITNKNENEAIYKDFKPDLSSSITLLSSMKNIYDDFLNTEFEYDVQIGIDVNI